MWKEEGWKISGFVQIRMLNTKFGDIRRTGGDTSGIQNRGEKKNLLPAVWLQIKQ